MVSIRVTARGFRNNENMLDFLKTDTETLDILLHRLALDIVNDSKTNIQINNSIRTGRLFNSIDIIDENPGESVTVGSDVEYSPFVEFGTVRMAAKPYMQPAVTKRAKKFADVYVTENEKQVKRRIGAFLDSELLD